MTIASTTSKSGPYVGNGVQTVFAISFACFAAADLNVIRTDPSGADVTLALNTDYSVGLNGDQTGSPGGTITMVVAPPTGYQLTILRNVALTQGTSLPNQGGWYPKVIENAFDKLTMIVQQLNERMSRSVQLGVTATDTSALVAAISGAAGNAFSASASATAAAASATSAAAAATAAANALPAAPGGAVTYGLESVGGSKSWQPKTTIFDDPTKLAQAYAIALSI